MGTGVGAEAFRLLLLNAGGVTCPKKGTAAFSGFEGALKMPEVKSLFALSSFDGAFGLFST